MNCSGIYCIKNTVNNKVYIGRAKDFKYRKRKHFYGLRNNIHDNIHLQNAYNKYGSENFEFHILEIVDDVNKLIEIEQWWIDNATPEYNICLNSGSSLGRKHSEEAKLKMSIQRKGKRPSDEAFDNALKANIKSVAQLDKKTGETIKIWPSMRSVEDELQIARQSISNACRNKIPSAGGYRWKYAE